MITEPQPAPPSTTTATGEPIAAALQRRATDWPRAICAFVISPIVGVLTFCLGLCATSRHPCLPGLVGFALFLSPFAWAATAAIGVPAFLMLRALGLTRAWQVTLGGGFVASLGAVAVTYDEHLGAGVAGLAGMVFVPGCVAGLTFWRMAFHRRPPTRPVV